MIEEQREEQYAAYLVWAREPLSEPPEVSVVIPAYNEEMRILPTVGAIAAHMCRRGRPWELIVADDGSRDLTVRLLEGLNLANLTILRSDRNWGKGNAVRRGVRAARGRYVLFADADQSTPIEQFDLLLSKIVDDGCDIVIGSRAAAGAQVANKSLARRAFSRGLRAVNRIGLGIRIRDTQCGFKLFTADSARELFDMQVIDGFSFDLEVLFLASHLRMKIAEVPVEWHDAPGSTVDATRVALHFLKELMRIRMYHLRGRYAIHAHRCQPIHR